MTAEICGAWKIPDGLVRKLNQLSIVTHLAIASTAAVALVRSLSALFISGKKARAREENIPIPIPLTKLQMNF